jgi:hypothetical protein
VAFALSLFFAASGGADADVLALSETPSFSTSLSPSSYFSSLSSFSSSYFSFSTAEHTPFAYYPFLLQVRLRDFLLSKICLSNRPIELLLRFPPTDLDFPAADAAVAVAVAAASSASSTASIPTPALRHSSHAPHVPRSPQPLARTRA